MKKWYQNSIIVILCLLFCLPLGLILLWRYSSFSDKAKKILSAVFLFTFFCALISSNNGTSSNVTQTSEVIKEVNTQEPVKELPSPTSSPSIEPMDLELALTPNVIDNKVSIDVSTNLPTNTNGIITLSNDDIGYTAQYDVVINNGSCSTDNFTYDGDSLPSGNYTITFSTPIYSVQPDDVKEKIGEDYCNYSSEFIITSDISSQNCIEFTQQLSLDEIVVEEPEVIESEESQSSEVANEVTVYWTSKGKRYHSNSGCSNMGSPYSGTIEEAEANGKTPCKKCY